MATVKLPQNSFTTGAVDYKRMRGRTDLNQYYNGAQELENVFIHPQGGTYRRDGTKFLNDYTSETYARLEVFEYSSLIKYLLVFYDDNIDIWQNDSLVHTITSTGMTDTQIMEMDVTQSFNSLIITHEDFVPKNLERGVSSTSWTLAAISFDSIPLYAFTLSTSQPAATLTPSATSSIIKLTAGSAVFSATDVGGYVTGNGGEARITKFISTTVVEANVTIPFVDTSAIASGSWDLENGYENAWSGSRGYPRCAVYHGDRLGFGGTPSLPDVVWFSAIGDFYNFDDTRTFANDAVSFNLRSDKVVEIRYMVSNDELEIFTSSAEYYVDGNITSELLFNVKRQDRRGVKENVKPVFVDGVSIFADAKADILREYAYNDVDSKYNAENLNLLSPHIFSGIVDLVHQRPLLKRDSDLVYGVNSDGTWGVLNTLRKQGITGFTTGKSREDSLKNITELDGEVYAIFERSIDGSTARYLEKFDSNLRLDCVYTYNGTATNTITGLSHLEGETVGIIADGTVHLDKEVSGGEVVLDSEYSVVDIGFKFTPRVVPLPPIRELPDGTMLGKIRRIVSVNIGMSDTFSMSVNDRLVEFYSFGQDILDNPPEEFSGRKRVTLRGYSREPAPVITQEQPLGFHINDLVMEVRV